MAIRKTTSTDRNSIPALIAVQYQHLESAKAEHAIQSLALMRYPEDKAQRNIVGDLEAEMAQHRQCIERLQAAEIAADKEQTVEDRQSAVDLHNDRMAELRRLTARIDTLTADILERISGITGPYADLGACMQERQALAWAIASTAVGSEQARKRFGAIGTAAGHIEIGTGIAHAVAAAGLGSGTLNLAPYVIVSPPGRQSYYSPSQMTAALEKRGTQLESMLAGVAPGAAA